MSHTTKIWKIAVETILGKEVIINEQQYDFMERKSTTGAQKR